MSCFRERAIDTHAGLLDRSRNHPLFGQIAAGAMSEQTLFHWLSQEYVYWSHDFQLFISQMIARGPHASGRALLNSQMSMHIQIELFEEILQGRGIDLSQLKPCYPTHAFGSYLLSVAAVQTFEEALAACYGCNLAYMEAWAAAGRALVGTVPWQDLIEQRTGPHVREWIERIAGLLDNAAEKAPASILPQMSESFGLSIEYQLAYWDGILAGTDW